MTKEERREITQRMIEELKERDGDQEVLVVNSNAEDFRNGIGKTQVRRCCSDAFMMFTLRMLMMELLKDHNGALVIGVTIKEVLERTKESDSKAHLVFILGQLAMIGRTKGGESDSAMLEALEALEAEDCAGSC